MLVVPGNINGPLKNAASFSGNPITTDGRDIPDLDDKSHSDGSEVGQMLRDANISIENTVYVGDDGGLSCGTSKATEEAQGFQVRNRMA